MEANQKNQATYSVINGNQQAQKVEIPPIQIPDVKVDVNLEVIEKTVAAIEQHVLEMASLQKNTPLPEVISPLKFEAPEIHLNPTIEVKPNIITPEIKIPELPYPTILVSAEKDLYFHNGLLMILGVQSLIFIVIAVLLFLIFLS